MSDITFGTVTADIVRGLTGLAFLQATIDGSLPQAPIREGSGIRLVEAREGWVKFTACPDETQQNPFGTIQGGWYAVLLDSALASAVISTQPAGVRVPTLEIKVNITRPLSPGTEVIATGETQHVGRSVAVACAEIRGLDGKLYATGTTTCMLVPA